MRRICAIAVSAAVAGAACAAQFEGVEVASGNVNAKDLTKLAKVEKAAGSPIVVVDRDGAARMVIVRADNRDADWAAKQLRETVEEMTGVKLAILVEKAGVQLPNAPAFYIGAVSAAERAGLKAPEGHAEAFSVVSKDGSIYFLGKRADYAVTDWCERELGVRYYWPMRPGDSGGGNYAGKGTNLIYGKCVPKTKGLAVATRAWTDRPVFASRDNWPYEGAEWNRWAKGGVSHRGGVNVHAPHGWWKEKDALEHVEIFALSQDGKRPNSPLLCYGNPKTLEYYKMRVKNEIERYRKDPKGKDTSGGVVRCSSKVVTISQWDCGVHCACEYCKKLFDEKLGTAGSGSPIIWGYFTREFAKWLKAEYPDYKIAILPYVNTCDVPPDPEDPSRPLDLSKYGNVEAELCTMPGLAMLKNEACKKHEEDLIRQWVKCTGNPVLNWHYSCWPAEFTSAPFVYGETIQRHYSDMRNDMVGSFINGGYDIVRFSLSVYVWMRCLWNPDLDVKAVYDEFAKRMFGKAAKPMRELIAMQEGGWNRQWNSNMCSVKNVFEISYPRKDVEKMQAILDEAAKLAEGDEKAAARIAWYRSGFAKFFNESEQNAGGVAFAPLHMKKAVTPPRIDGKLDDACWQNAEPLSFVAGQLNWSSKPEDDKGKDPKKPPAYPTEVKVVWVPGEGVTFGFRFTEPVTSAMKVGVKGDVWGQDMIEVFLDASGSGDGHFYHILTDAFGRVNTNTDGIEWKPQGIVSKSVLGDGFWTMEVFLPFADVEKFPRRQLPTTSANGCCWTGNLIRFRVGDARVPKEARQKGSHEEISRLNTRFSKWNKDPAAFSEWKFVE
ncbi:MAG: DUF4838 domain-containing protein [Kiritimatiellae bacterium]|nr:DUF4838 domain-containing protein [Kiritimatiellia bacterium]